MTIRRIADPTADRALIEESQATIGRPVTFETWREHATSEGNVVHLDDSTRPAKLLHVDFWQRERAQIIFWTPMKVTLRADFLLTLPVLAEFCRAQLAATPLSASWPIYGHAPRAICQAWGTYFGPIVMVEPGDSNPDYPRIEGTYRARSTIGQIAARIPELLL